MAIPSSSPSSNPEFVSVVVKEDDLQKPLLLSDDDHDAIFTSVTAKESKHSGSSFPRTCLNTCNAISGMGVLSMPYALSQGGWSSLAVFFLVAGICYYTGLLIQRCMNSDPFVRTFPDIGEHAFGPKGKLAISVFMYLELYLVGVSFLILEGDNLDKMFPGVDLDLFSLRIEGKLVFVLLSALVILPTTWLQNLGMLAYVSAGGVMASAILLGSLLWAGVAETGFGEQGRVINWRGLPTAFGLFFMCFTCHAVFPTISSSMKDSTQFPKVLSVSFIVCTVNYGLMGIVGYLMYGDELMSQVTLNLPAGKIYTRVAIFTVAINPIAKYALAITPITRVIEQRLGFREGRPMSLLTRTLLLCSTVIIAITFPFFGYLMAFIGSFLCVTVSVLFPCVCYLKIFGLSQVRRLELFSISVILVVASVVAVVGTYSSLRDIFCN